jgi:hypothetical protein
VFVEEEGLLSNKTKIVRLLKQKRVWIGGVIAVVLVCVFISALVLTGSFAVRGPH